jgi:hypothetical protein
LAKPSSATHGVNFEAIAANSASGFALMEPYEHPRLFLNVQTIDLVILWAFRYHTSIGSEVCGDAASGTG